MSILAGAALTGGFSKRLLFMASALIASAGFCALRASAPESLAGLAYDQQLNVYGVRAVYEFRGTFDDAGRFQDTWARGGTTMSKLAASITGNYIAPRSGTCTYVKTGPDTATLTWNFEEPWRNDDPANSPAVWNLVFSQTPSEPFLYEATATMGNEAGRLKLSQQSGGGALENVSTRVRVRSGEPTIVGFIARERSDFLIRVSGPALTHYGVDGVWAAPTFSVHGADGALVRLWVPVDEAKAFAENSAGVPLTWDETDGFRRTNNRAFTLTGAFPFEPGSKDVSVVATLSGATTIVLEAPAGDTGGQALVEVYRLP
ncbi:hypothetical protein DB347_23095 [Opitutaceae bacterium EW11]|nr:hypothetical protein DB347_23095 [Opitutaceae bacterium EW11]